MRLLKPNPGECADRQTILELKIKYGMGVGDTKTTAEVVKTQVGMLSRTTVETPVGVNVQPFIDENEQIQQYLEKNWFPDLKEHQGPEFDRIYEELQELNHQVWKLTDQSHTLKEAPDRMQEQANRRAAEVLFQITELNDKRAELVRKINELWSVRVQEKIFA